MEWSGRWWLPVLLMLGLGACGKKGPLYLPPDKLPPAREVPAQTTEQTGQQRKQAAAPEDTP